MKRQTSPQSGYTLIELLLYVVIVGALLSSVVVFFGTMTSARVKNQTISEVNDQGTAVMNYILQTARNANSISAPATGGTATNSLTLAVPTASLSPTIFSLSGTVLQVKEGASAAIALTNSEVQVTSFSVKNLTRPGTAGLAQVSFTLSRVNPNGRNEFDYQKTFTSSAELGW